MWSSAEAGTKAVNKLFKNIANKLREIFKIDNDKTDKQLLREFDLFYD